MIVSLGGNQVGKMKKNKYFTIILFKWKIYKT